MARVFISYSHHDSEFVQTLAGDLRDRDVPIWLDQFDIPPGARWDDEVEKALESASHFLLVLSKTSVDSPNVRDELAVALDEGKTVVPVRIEDCKIPLRVRRMQYTDFQHDYAEALARLVAALPVERGRPAETARPAAPPLPTARPVELPACDVFVSYAREDSSFLPFGGGLLVALKRRGFRACSGVPPSKPKMPLLDQFQYHANWRVEPIVEKCAVFILIASPTAWTSDAVKREIGCARRYDKPVVVLRSELYSPAQMTALVGGLRVAHETFFSNKSMDYDKKLETLVGWLREFVP